MPGISGQQVAENRTQSGNKTTAASVVRETAEGDGTLIVSTPRVDKLIDDTGTYVYVGAASIGALESDPVWTVKRIKTTPPVTVGHACTANSSGKLTKLGTPDYSWSDRASLTYSR